jgi:hypothetical protein
MKLRPAPRPVAETPTEDQRRNAANHTRTEGAQLSMSLRLSGRFGEFDRQEPLSMSQRKAIGDYERAPAPAIACHHAAPKTPRATRAALHGEARL